MLNYYNNHHLYTVLEMQRAAISPVNMAAHMCKGAAAHPFNPLSYTPLGRGSAAFCELVERMTRHYSKPEFGIKDTRVAGEKFKIEEVSVCEKTFCDLIHFKKLGFKKKQPKLLIVAPVSGHFATLLRGTVIDTLPHFDVYITDWMNVCDVALSEGPFDLDDYINYVIDFIRIVGEDVNLMAVCQPSVPVYAAAAIMAAEKDPLIPKTITLIGGPIDTRNNPTKVNKLAEERSMEWFESNVITHVPINYVGFMRKVYPGFIQLSGFMTMNLDRHIGEHMGLFLHLVEGDGDSADSHRKFYNEYLSVMDLPAEFYLQTVEEVFQKHSLPKGEMVSKGRKVDPKAIKNTAILAIEGERDDISGRDQTKAALDISTSLPAEKKHYHLQKNVGHYGTFNGTRFRDEVVPVIKEFIKKHS